MCMHNFQVVPQVFACNLQILTKVYVYALQVVSQVCVMRFANTLTGMCMRLQVRVCTFQIVSQVYVCLESCTHVHTNAHHVTKTHSE